MNATFRVFNNVMQDQAEVQAKAIMVMVKDLLSEYDLTSEVQLETTEEEPMNQYKIRLSGFSKTYQPTYKVELDRGDWSLRLSTMYLELSEFSARDKGILLLIQADIEQYLEMFNND